MNTSADESDRNALRYAEYVLGVLEADARADVEHEIVTSDAAAVAVELWQRRLAGLVETLPEVTPSAEVWSRIQRTLNWNPTPETRRSGSSWNSLRLWQWLGAGAAAVATACVVLLLTVFLQPHPPTLSGTLMVSSIRESSGAADWTATMDLDRKQIVVVPAAGVHIPGDRSTQLWLIPAGQAPISVGVFKPDSTTVLQLNPTLLARLGPTATLAVSVEPFGGSPSGQPTGAVIAKGAISAAPAATVSG